jgi:hypothetical protein
MNTTTTTNTHTAPRRMVAGFAAAVITSTLLGTVGTTAAHASEPRGQSHAVSTTSAGGYGEPLAALGGRTLAQYLSDHWARIVRTPV